MKKLDLYVLKELAIPLLVGTVIIAILFVLNEFIAIYRYLQVSHIPGSAIVKLVLLRMPYWLTYTLPTGLALGSSLAISRLVRESELTAMRAAGIRTFRVLRPVFIVAAILTVSSFFIFEKVVPKAQEEHLKLSSDLLILGSLPKFERDVMIKLPPYLAIFGEVERLDDDSLILRDILLVERIAPGELTVYTARQGRYAKGVWTIDGAFVRLFKNEWLVQIAENQQLTINQEIDLRALLNSQAPDSETLDELWERIENGRLAGSDTTSLEVTFYERFSIPASCIIFAWFSCLLALRFSKTSAFQGLLISMASVGLYFNVHIVSTLIIGKNGWLPPMWSAWLSIIIFGSISLLWSLKIR